MFCVYCGKSLPDGSRVCCYCGKPVVELKESAADAAENQNPAAVPEPAAPPADPPAAEPAPDVPEMPEQPAAPDVQPMPVLVPEAPVSPELPVPEIPGEGFPEGPDMPQPGAPEVEIPGAPTLHPEPLPQVEIPQVHEAVTAHGEPSEEPAAVLEEIPMVSIDGGEETSSNTAQSTQGGVLHTARRDRPVSTVGFFWTEFLLLIPLLNLVLLFVWAFREKTNRNRRAFARSVLIWILIALLSLLAVLIVMIVTRQSLDINYWIQQLKDLVNSIPLL